MSRVLGEPKGRGEPFDRRKLEVLKVAAKLFNEQGFHNTTLDDVASALQVTKPALYYYASSKDQILFEIGELALDKGKRLVANTMKMECPGSGKLRRFFEAWTLAICQDLGRCLILTKPQSLKRTTRQKNEISRRMIHDQVVTIIRQGVDDGSLRDCDARLMALALFDLFNGISYWYRPGGNKTPQKIASEYWNSFGRGLVCRHDQPSLNH